MILVCNRKANIGGVGDQTDQEILMQCLYYIRCKNFLKLLVLYVFVAEEFQSRP